MSVYNLYSQNRWFPTSRRNCLIWADKVHETKVCKLQFINSDQSPGSTKWFLLNVCDKINDMCEWKLKEKLSNGHHLNPDARNRIIQTTEDTVIRRVKINAFNKVESDTFLTQINKLRTIKCVRSFKGCKLTDWLNQTWTAVWQRMVAIPHTLYVLQSWWMEIHYT